jgi:hypothetical protein
VLSLLPACGGGTTVDAGGGPGPAGTGQPSTALVVLVRSGGIAGLHDLVSVDASGVATVVRDRPATQSTRTLTSTELAALRAALERSDITGLKRNYLDRQAADAFQYDVTYQGVTVTADEGVLPVTLRPVVDILTRLIAR